MSPKDFGVYFDFPESNLQHKDTGMNVITNTFKHIAQAATNKLCHKKVLDNDIAQAPTSTFPHKEIPNQDIAQTATNTLRHKKFLIKI